MPMGVEPKDACAPDDNRDGASHSYAIVRDRQVSRSARSTLVTVGIVSRLRSQMTVGLWRGRPPLSAVGAFALVAVLSAAGCSGSGTAKTNESSPQPVPTAVSCPGGNVNSGSPDSVGEAKGVSDVLEDAGQWANATGFADRFPSARLTVGQGPDSALARFVHQNQLRAQLTYRKVADNWTLDTLEYC